MEVARTLIFCAAVLWAVCIHASAAEPVNLTWAQCVRIRADVAYWGVDRAEAWARDQGWSAEKIAAARRCVLTGRP